MKIILEEEKIKRLLNIKDVINIVEKGFRKKGLGLVSLTPKMGPKLNVDGAFADSMPVAVFNRNKKLETYGIKWLSVYKSNLKKGLPYINSLIILNNPETGIPEAILKGNWITAIRTAAVSAVTSKYLAPKKKNIVIGIFGLGLQAYVHVLAFKAIYKNPKFILFNHNKKTLKDFLSKFKSMDFQIENDFHKVTKISDVILSATTFTPEINPYIYEKDLKKDVLILPLDYGSRIDPKVYKILDEVYTDDISQYELKSKIRTYFPKNRPVIKKEVGDLVSEGFKRKNNEKRVLVFNLGIALFDILTAKSVVNKY